MKKIEKNGVIYAVYDSLDTLEKGSVWYGEDKEWLQVSRMQHDRGKVVLAHIHKLRPRTIEHTQECLIDIRGSAKASIYDKDKNFLDSFILKTGDIVVFYRGYHGLEVLEDGTVYFEIKNGPFTGINEDKEFIDNI